VGLCQKNGPFSDQDIRGLREKYSDERNQNEPETEARTDGAGVKPGELRAVMEGFVDESGAPGALALTDPSRQQGVDKDGEAVISRWWSVWFFEGTREQQEERLKKLRLDPRFQKPCSDGRIPVRFEGGATCEDVYLRLSERRLC
jgi:hypothetical protein